MKSNVVRFSRHGTTFAIPDEMMQVLREQLYKFDVQEAADFMGVSRSCIYSIRSGRSKWPRGENMFRLLRLLDIEIRLYAVKEGRYL